MNWNVSPRPCSQPRTIRLPARDEPSRLRPRSAAAKVLGVPAPFVVGPAALVITGEKVLHRPVDAALGVIGAEDQRPIEIAHRLVKMPELNLHEGEVVICLGVVRLFADDSLKNQFGFLVLIEARGGNREVVPCDRVFRIDRDHAVINFDRLGEFPGIGQGDAEVVERRDAQRRQLDCSAQDRIRPFQRRQVLGRRRPGYSAHRRNPA